MALNCIIIDDELHACEQLIEYINDTPTLKLVKSYTDPVVALAALEQNNEVVDILFTDIEMPKLSGLKLAKQIRHKFKFLVLVSGHINYAPDGYKISANYFLTKPFNYKKFYSCIDTILQLQSTLPSLFIKVKDKKGVLRIWIDEIIYISSDRNYINLHFKGRTITTMQKLSVIEEMLEEHGFLRIHKSYIVAIRHIEKYKNGFVYMSDGATLSVSVTFKERVNHYFDIVHMSK